MLHFPLFPNLLSTTLSKRQLFVSDVQHERSDRRIVSLRNGPNVRRQSQFRNRWTRYQRDVGELLFKFRV